MTVIAAPHVRREVPLRSRAALLMSIFGKLPGRASLF
jgi:hypothetical protein